VKPRFTVLPGRRFPPGATWQDDGVNFCVFSRHAERMELRIYPDDTAADPVLSVSLDPRRHRTFFFWHVLVRGVRPGMTYTYRAQGPWDPSRGLRFDPRRELLDPWARAVSDRNWNRTLAKDPEQGWRTAIRALVPDPEPYDWEGDTPLDRPAEQEIIYEMHVGGFTRHPSSGVRHPGTFRGLIEKIPYLRELGVTAVELLPIMAFDPQDVPDSVARRGLRNFWGYCTHSFFAPHPAYCCDPSGKG